MVCFLHAELVSDGQRIALIADGEIATWMTATVKPDGKND